MEAAFADRRNLLLAALIVIGSFVVHELLNVEEAAVHLVPQVSLVAALARSLVLEYPATGVLTGPGVLAALRLLLLLHPRSLDYINKSAHLKSINSL